jgi:hypothetical protein
MISKVLKNPLGIKDDVSLTAQQAELVSAIEEYDLWFVAERLETKGVLTPHLINECIIEFKKYMALCGLGYKDLSVISPEIDEVWHNFILFTREYNKFCESVFGKFIHHTPSTSRNPMAFDNGMSFVIAYNRTFGELPAIWHGEKLKHLLTHGHGTDDSGDPCAVASCSKNDD